MNTCNGTDILMITHNRPGYARLSLPRLLETCDESCRVWLWHNGGDEKTLEVARSFREHPRVHRFFQSAENRKLREPTNWLWENSEGHYVGKVDDDCLVSAGWIQQLRRAHELKPDLGVVASCHFWPGDLDLNACRKKVESLGEGLSLLRNCWVGGSAYLMKRECIASQGLLREKESWTEYCIRLALAGWKIGWLVPLVAQEHMDDPRSPHCRLKTDADLQKLLPLSARMRGVKDLVSWQAQLQRSASFVQTASIDPRHYIGWRARAQMLRRRTRRLIAALRDVFSSKS